MKFPLISLLFIGFSAHAAEPRTAVLHHVTIDGQPTRYVAALSVQAGKEIEISILNDICGHYATLPPGTMRCMAMPIAVRTLHAKVLKQSADGCGSLVTLAMTDATPVDGVRTEIAVKDHAHRKCDDVRIAVLEVNASVFNPWTNQTTAYEIH